MHLGTGKNFIPKVPAHPKSWPALLKTSSWLGFLILGALGIWHFHDTEFLTRFNLVPGGRGDNRLVMALLEYMNQSFHGVGDFLSPAFYYPAQRTRGYSEAFMAHGFLYLWLRSLHLDIFTCFQICVLVFNLLNYLLFFGMLRRGLGLGTTASSLGAFLAAFNAPKFNQISESQMQFLCGLVIVSWALVVFIRKGQTLSQSRVFLLLSVSGLALSLQILTCFYLAWFFCFWAVLFLLLAMVLGPSRNFLTALFRRFQKAILGAGLVFGISLIPFVWIYFPILSEMGGKDYSEVRMYLPTWISFLWMGPRHAWWGWLWDKCPSIQTFAVEEGERLGLGLAILAAWVSITVWAAGILWKFIKQKKRSHPEYRKAMEGNKVLFLLGLLAILASTLFCLIGLDYGGGLSPWWFVFKWVPGGGSIRGVSRYIVFVTLPVSAVLAWAWQTALQRAWTARKTWIKYFLTSGIFLWAFIAVFEQVNMPPAPAMDKPLELNRLEYLSEKLPASCKLFYVTVAPGIPYNATDIQVDAMLISAARGIKTFNGYSGNSPEDWWLYRVRSPHYDQYVKNWINLHNIQEPVCDLVIDK